MASTPVLDLDQLTDRPTVRIGGKEYRLYTIDLLPPLDNYRIKRLIKRGDALSAKDELTNVEETELNTILDQIVRIVLAAPDAIHKKLHDRQRVEIFQSFHTPSLQALLKLLPATAPPDAATSTGESSSDASAGSTQP